MFIHYYMSKNPLMITGDTSVEQARLLLQKHRFRHLPVIDQDEKLLGMITDRDLRSASPSSLLSEEDREIVSAKVSSTPVSELMAPEFFFLQTVSTLDDALLLFSSHSIGALPVVESAQKVVGIFSLNDMTTAYQRLFGLGEKGSMLVCVQDTAEAGLLGKIVTALDSARIECSRLVRSSNAESNEPAAIYLRVNTYNLSSVHKTLERIGCTIMVPDRNQQGDIYNA